MGTYGLMSFWCVGLVLACAPRIGVESASYVQSQNPAFAANSDLTISVLVRLI